MSVKERMEQINKDHRATEKQASENGLKEGQVAFQARYSDESREAKRQQMELLRELKRLGIVAMVEEIIEGPIKVEEEKREVEATEGEVQVFERVDDLSTDDVYSPRLWRLDMPRPTLSEEGVWDNSLVMELIKTSDHLKYGIYLTAQESKDTPKAVVKFTYDRILLISGEEVTFGGIMRKDESGRLEVIEQALAEALVNLKKPEPRFAPPTDWRLDPIKAAS